VFAGVIRIPTYYFSDLHSDYNIHFRLKACMAFSLQTRQQTNFQPKKKRIRYVIIKQCKNV